MSQTEIVHWGSDRLRVGPWRGDHTVAQITPAPTHSPTRPTIERCLAVLAGRGYRAVLTSALAEPEQQAFLQAGFTVHERLHLLRHHLDALPPARPPRGRLRRGRRRDLTEVLSLDAAAFSAFWRFDDQGLADAREATPSARFRVAVEGGRPVGYAVTGRAGDTGYLQRLAVLPARQGEGIGTALVGDSLGWARRHRATSVLVNTQESNQGALRLYEHLGFRQELPGLAVLERALDPDGPPG